MGEWEFLPNFVIGFKQHPCADPFPTMKLVTLPDSRLHPLPFYLAEEEWLARNGGGEDFFFMWQVEPTVIIGRNQLAHKEVDLDFCRAHGIRVVRRKSGGGAVFADMNNLMLSYVTSSGDGVATTFAAYTGMVAAALRSLGLDAAATSRNDVLIGGRKVSGNSFYRLGDRSIAHGTMLYDCDRDLMARVLRPAPAKLRSHGVESVRSRVTTIREHMPDTDISTFRTRLTEAILAGGIDIRQLTPDEVNEIERLSLEYHDPARITRLNPKADVEAEAYFDGIGTIKAHVTLLRGRIDDFSLTGDYLETADASASLGELLKGSPYDAAQVEALLESTDLGQLIPGLTPGHLMKLIF